MSEGEKIKCCPFCGGHGILGRDTESDDNYETDYWLFYVFCENNCVTTKWSKSAEEVLRIWQTRTPEK